MGNQKINYHSNSFTVIFWGWFMQPICGDFGDGLLLGLPHYSANFLDKSTNETETNKQAVQYSSQRCKPWKLWLQLIIAFLSALLNRRPQYESQPPDMPHKNPLANGADRPRDSTLRSQVSLQKSPEAVQPSWAHHGGDFSAHRLRPSVPSAFFSSWILAICVVQLSNLHQPPLVWYPSSLQLRLDSSVLRTL